MQGPAAHDSGSFIDHSPKHSAAHEQHQPLQPTACNIAPCTWGGTCRTAVS
jgi:hypothetical protein